MIYSAKQAFRLSSDFRETTIKKFVEDTQNMIESAIKNAVISGEYDVTVEIKYPFTRTDEMDDLIFAYFINKGYYCSVQSRTLLWEHRWKIRWNVDTGGISRQI